MPIEPEMTVQSPVTEVGVAVSYHVCVGPEPGGSERGANAFNCCFTCLISTRIF